MFNEQLHGMAPIYRFSYMEWHRFKSDDFLNRAVLRQLGDSLKIAVTAICKFDFPDDTVFDIDFYIAAANHRAWLKIEMIHPVFSCYPRISGAENKP